MCVEEGARRLVVGAPVLAPFVVGIVPDIYFRVPNSWSIGYLRPNEMGFCFTANMETVKQR